MHLLVAMTSTCLGSLLPAQGMSVWHTDPIVASYAVPGQKPFAVMCFRQFADLVLYIEACEAGSMFEGLLNDSLNIYATTAANAHESSWGTYCPGMHPSSPPEFNTCLGDLYSISWMENR